MSDGSDPPSPKRPRVRLACVACRQRKTRCDGRQPICIACESRGVAGTCTYEPSQRQAQDFRRPSNASQRVRRRSNARPKDLPELNSTQRVDPEDVDGLATVPAYSSTDHLYGPSSSVAFSRAVGLASNDHDVDKEDYASQRPSAARTYKRSNFLSSLPKRHTADELLRCFWDFMHPVFPILHKPTFIDQYTKLWRKSEEPFEGNATRDGDDAIFECTLSLVFAIGSKFSSSITLAGRDEVANGFYQTFRRSYTNDFLDSPSLALVQMMLLEGVYLQSSQNPSRCWNVVGLAVRIAQTLGLHVERGGDQVVSQLQRELRRRIWHNCVSLDRLLSMTSGLPKMITNSGSIPLPLTIDDEYLTSTAVSRQPAHTVSYMSLFVSSCHLFDILSAVLQLFEDHDLTVSPQTQSNAAERLEDVVIQTLKISRRLDEFLATTPPELKLLDSPPTPILDQYSILNLQQQILYCRFLYVRMLSLRPLLMHAISAERVTGEQIVEKAKSSLLGREFVRQCCQQCVETAQKLVKTIYDNLCTPYRSAGWHAVYFVFSAATCVLAASQSSMMNTTLHGDVFNTFWDRCLLILKAHEAYIVTAKRAIKVLEAKKQRILSGRARTFDSNGYASSSSLARSSLTDGENNLLSPVPETGITEPFDMQEAFDMSNIDITWLDQCLANLDWLDPTAGDNFTGV